MTQHIVLLLMMPAKHTGLGTRKIQRKGVSSLENLKDPTHSYYLQLLRMAMTETFVTMRLL